MRLVEFLILLLEAHAETLKRLAALFGEENLVHLLELAGEEEVTEDEPPEEIPIDLTLFESPAPASPSAPYTELEGAVRELNLPAVLEFHLWAYPIYRSFIESPLDLNARIPGPGGDAGIRLVDQAIAEAEVWVKRLPMADLVRNQAERAAHVPWLRFRTTTLRRIGKRPMGPVY